MTEGRYKHLIGNGHNKKSDKDRRRGRRIPVYVTHDEKTKIEACAKTCGTSVSSFLIRAALEFIIALDEERKKSNDNTSIN